jgi:hypothetical protein
LCLAPLVPLDETADVDATAETVLPNTVRPGQFSLTTLLLVTTLFAGCLGLLKFDACLGVFALLFSAPAVIRTAYLGANEAKRGHRLSIYEKVMAFLASVAVLIMASFVGATVLVLIGSLVGPAIAVITMPQPLSLAVLILWITVGLVAAGWVVWALRPPRR